MADDTVTSADDPERDPTTTRTESSDVEDTPVDDTGTDETGSDETAPDAAHTDDAARSETATDAADVSGVDDAPGVTPSDIVDDGSANAFDAMALERDQYLDALRRLQADFENFRKQALKRQGDAIEHATGRLVEQLLPVLDACDAGLEHGDEGVTAIFTALLGVLEKNGMERLDPVGEPFDPNAHEAVMHEPAEDGEESDDGPIVVEVMRPGYRWKERTLRAAMVKVKG